MGILIILGVLNLKDSQINGRDSERKSDTEAIALQLENYYLSGAPNSSTTGNYPALDELIGSETNILTELSPDSLKAPNKTSSSFLAATNNTQTTAGVTPTPTIDTYIYQPIASDGSLCAVSTQDCRKFNLYYKNEIDGTINIIRSKNQ